MGFRDSRQFIQRGKSNIKLDMLKRHLLNLAKLNEKPEMSVAYTIAFTAGRSLLPGSYIPNKKITKALQTSPFGPWKPGTLDHPELTRISLHREIDPLLGYDKRWLVNALLDHLLVQEQRIESSGMNSIVLADIQFSLSRLDELADKRVTSLEHLRALAEANIY